MKYAITGASGLLGRETASRLLELVDPEDVALLTRTPSTLTDFAARGASVREADFSKPDSLVKAFAGVQRLMLISIDLTPERLTRQVDAIAAAKLAGVERIAYTSTPQPSDDNPAMVVPDHAGTERYLKASGLEWTMLRNNTYAQLEIDALKRAAAQGRLVTNNGTGRVAYVTREDCAAAAAHALVSSDAANRAFDITGPESLGDDELAQLATRIGNRTVEVVRVDDTAFTASSVASGIPRPMAEMITSFGTSIRGGFFANVTDTVAELTGRAPTSLAELVEQVAR